MIKLIAKEINYNVYEVADVIEGLRRVTTNALCEGREVKIEHLITLIPKVNKPKNFKNLQTGLDDVSDGSVTCMVKPAQYLKDCLNGTVIEESSMVESRLESTTETSYEPDKPRRKFTAEDQLSLL